MNHWLLILAAATSNVALNLFLKKGGQGLDTTNLRGLVLSILTSGWMWLAVASAVMLLTAFVAAIRIYSLSLTYTAVTSLAMVALTVVGALLQHEALSLMRVVGLALIIVGLVVSAVATSA